MERLSYDPQSWEKKRASDSILQYLIQNSEYQLEKIANFLFLQNKNTSLSDVSLGTLLQYVKEENLDNFLFLWKMYEQSKNDISKADWYIKRIFLRAKSLEAAKLCIPKQYWKYFQGVTFTGDGDMNIKDEYHYALLEQAAMNNMILGIRNTT